MGTAELKTRTFSVLQNNKHLQLASQYVSDSWIPPNPELLSEIQKKLKDGSYVSDTKLLVKDLARDVALFTFCLKNLKSLVKGTKNFSNPVEALENAALEDLKKLLVVQDGVISNHKFADTTKEQALCIQQTMISSRAAETLADKASVDPKVAQTCGVLRQLGLTLVAWNYPHVYMRAVSMMPENGDLDGTLTRVLGFSPQMLAIKLASEWGIGPEIRVGMGDHSMIATNDEAKVENTISQLEFKSVGEKLSRLCEIGEALARANDPDHYPSASRDWDLAKKEIEYYLGKDGIQIIHAKIREGCQDYYKNSPDFFKPLFELEPQTKVSNSDYVYQLIGKNLYLSKLPAPVIDKLKSAYRTCEPNKVSRDSLNIIISEAITAAGFIKGCLYLVDPIGAKLVPRIKIGNTTLQQYKVVSYNSAGSEQDPIVMAFQCRTPIKEENVTVAGAPVSFVAGVMGESQKAGVLFLEIGEGLLRDTKSDPVIFFKAIRLALQASLGLN